MLSTLFGRFPFLTRLFADRAYAGPVFDDGLANATPDLITEIVRRCDQVKGFVVRVARSLSPSPLAFLRIASIRLMLRKLCNPS